MQRCKVLSVLTVPFLAAALITGAGPAIAETAGPAAVPGTIASRAAVSKWESKLATAAATQADAAVALGEYQGLTPYQKARFVDVITSSSPLDAPEVVQVRTSTISRTPAATSSNAAISIAQATTATVYDVSATWGVNSTIFGVVLGRFNQTFRYQTGSGVVLTTQYCHGSFTGYSGFLSLSASDSRYVASGRGYCITDFVGSVLYKGSAISLNKRMTIVTNGPGIVSETLVNI
jgi:hypothetical protein